MNGREDVKIYSRFCFALSHILLVCEAGGWAGGRRIKRDFAINFLFVSDLYTF